MKILNGKRSTLVFQLDNGQNLTVQPGKFSEPFVGTLSMIRAIIGAGSDRQVGFVVSNSYELNMLNDVPAATAYYHATEEEAVKAIIEGNEALAQVSPSNPDMVRIAKLESQVAEAKTKLDEQKAYYENLLKEADDKVVAQGEKIKSLEEKIETQKREIQASEVEIKSKQSKIDELNVTLENTKMSSDVIAEKDAEIETLNKALEAKDEDLKAAQQKAADDKTPELTAKIEELTNSLNEKSEEIEKLKSDASTILDKYNRAAEAAKHIMQKFNINYIDGDYVQTVN